MCYTSLQPHLRYTVHMSTHTTNLAFLYAQRSEYLSQEAYFVDIGDGFELEEVVERQGTLNLPFDRVQSTIDGRRSLVGEEASVLVLAQSDFIDYLECALGLVYGSVRPLGTGFYLVIESETSITECFSATIQGMVSEFRIEHPEWLMGHLRRAGVIPANTTYVIML